MALAQFEVIGRRAIRDSVTGALVSAPDVVTLDTEKILIPMLVEFGHVKPVEDKPKVKKGD